MKLNKIDTTVIIRKLKTIPMAIMKLIKRVHARFQALPIEQRRELVRGTILFISGMLLGILMTLGISKASNNSHADAESASDVATSSANSTDWSDLVSNMCQPHSALNLLAMKMDFPFAKCMRDNGQIDSACVKQDATRFKPTLPHPYQSNLGEIQTHISHAEDGLPIVHYVIPLNDVAFQQLPLTKLAVNIATQPAPNAPTGWQTPHLVIQGDYSSIRSALANVPPQTVYYAHIPANSDALPGPFETYNEAKIVTRKAGGKVNLISKQIMTLQANFQDGLNEVSLNCVASK